MRGKGIDFAKETRREVEVERQTYAYLCHDIRKTGANINTEFLHIKFSSNIWH